MTDGTTTKNTDISSAIEQTTVSSDAASSDESDYDSNSSDKTPSSVSNESSESSSSSSSEEANATRYSSRIEGNTPSMPVSYEKNKYL